MPQFTARDDTHRYVIGLPLDVQIKLNHQGRDWVGVYSPDLEEVVWLTDFLLIAAARDGDMGLSIVSEELLEARQEVEPFPGQDAPVVIVPQEHERP